MIKKFILKHGLIKITMYAILIISIVQLFTIEEIVETPVGTYKSKGGIIKVCEGSEEVYNYLGM